MKQEKRSAVSLAESTPQRGTDPLERLMNRLGVPVTRQSYLDLAYLGRPPAELSAEEEANIPKSLRKATSKATLTAARPTTR